jgi:hypothetical protein
MRIGMIGEAVLLALAGAAALAFPREAPMGRSGRCGRPTGLTCNWRSTAV